MKKIFLLMFLLTSPCFAADFSVQSSSWPDGATMKDTYVYNSFGCKGNNVSPQVSWSNAPDATKSFAVTVYDPDAPTGSGWWHWTLFNIPATVSQINEGASLDQTKLPAGSMEGRTDFGKSGYGGACPPQGDKPHHYILTVYALKIDKINLNGDSSGALLGYFLNQNTLAKASLTAKYSR
jgi:hypothetical protein